MYSTKNRIFLMILPENQTTTTDLTKHRVTSEIYSTR